MSVRRKIVHIDEEKCDGCGLCVPSCAEGAIRIIGGKARLVSEVYCDGLGACLGHCPQGAISVEEREAAEFDEQAVQSHLAASKEVRGERREARGERREVRGERQEAGGEMQEVRGDHARAQGVGGCPGALSRMLQPRSAAQPGATAAGGNAAATAGSGASDDASAVAPQLANWPVQLHLAPIRAPYFENARLLIAADCVPFAYPEFHPKLLAGRVLLIGCPKLDEGETYRAKLAEIFRANSIQSVEVAHMEVPCCFGLVQLVRQALRDAAVCIPLSLVKIGIRGEIKERSAPEALVRS
jgi:NAD-dependent dihydropyrimidine dehydrogenase PreA subunit